MIGTKIGLYEITSQIGQGGMGAVYVATHQRIGHRKVVKVLLPEHSRDEGLLRRFETEAKAAAKLHHRNITKLDDFNRLPTGEWFIMMPFLDGSPLDSLLPEREPLSLHQALQILAQVCAALHAAHSAGIVHRDLKPANIFISRTEDNPQHVTLLDFGIAKIAAEADAQATQTGMSFGTPAYMAAEQFVDASRVDERSDIFALGVIAYQMVTGDLPFGRGPSAVLYTRQHEQRPTLPPNLPQGWREAILKALALHPRDRHPSAHAFAVALAAATPEAPPLPDGVQILRDVAKELVVYAPANGHTVPARSSASFDAVPILPLPERGAVALAPDLTTLSGLAGQQGSPKAQGVSPRSRWWLAGLGVGVAGGTATLIVLVMQLSSSTLPARTPVADEASSSASQPQEPMTRPPAATSPSTLSLSIEAEPPDANLFIDGDSAGKAPVKRTFTAGAKVLLRAEKRGYVPQERMVQVVPTVPTVTLVLERTRSGTQKASKPSAAPAPPRRAKFDPDGAGGT